MAFLTDHAICLRKLDYSQTSQLLLLFTQTLGPVKVLAKGAFRRTKKGHSKFDGGLDLFDLGQAVISHSPQKELSLLTEWALEDGHLELRGSIRGLMLAHFLTEITAETLAAHDPHPQLFLDLAYTIPRLATPAKEQWALWYLQRTMSESGFMPDLAACTACSRPLESVKSVPAAAYVDYLSGFVCASCADAYPTRQPIDPRLLRIAATVMTTPTTRLPALTRHQTDPLIAIYTSHLQYLLSHGLRSAPFVLPRPAMTDMRQYY